MAEWRPPGPGPGPGPGTGTIQIASWVGLTERKKPGETDVLAKSRLDLLAGFG